MFSYTSRRVYSRPSVPPWGPCPALMNKDTTRVYRSHCGNTELCKTRLENMGPSKSWYIAALLRWRSLNCCKGMNRKLIGKTSRRTGNMGRGHSLIHWAAASRLVGCVGCIRAQARAPTYRCSPFFTIHHVDCPNYRLHIHLAI
jgi:hypothetical protein